MRKLKYQEQKLLKKVDFFNWKSENNLHQIKILKKFQILRRSDYTIYNKLSQNIRELSAKISEIDSKDRFRTEMSAMLLEKLFVLGLIPTKWDLNNATKLTASSFCRRRLPVVMVRNKMAQNLKDATQMIEHGHVRVGPDVVKDPAYMVSRTIEDFVTWVDSSKIRKHVLDYNDMKDDFEM